MLFNSMHQISVHNCHCEERSDVAIRSLTLQISELFRKISLYKGERIATPVCALVHNDSRGRILVR